jgi:hypothetical protein
LTSYSVADLDRRYNPQLPGIYSENVKRGILWEAIDFIEGKKGFHDLSSNLDDHSVPAHIMSAIYVSHIRRIAGLNPVIAIDLSYDANIGPSMSDRFTNYSFHSSPSNNQADEGIATASIRPSLDVQTRLFLSNKSFSPAKLRP